MEHFNMLHLAHIDTTFGMFERNIARVTLATIIKRFFMWTDWASPNDVQRNIAKLLKDGLYKEAIQHIIRFNPDKQEIPTDDPDDTYSAFNQSLIQLRDEPTDYIKVVYAHFQEVIENKGVIKLKPNQMKRQHQEK